MTDPHTTAPGDHQPAVGFVSPRLQDVLAPLVARAVDRQRAGDEVVWEAGMMPVGSAVAPVVVVWMPAPVLGQVLTAAHVVQDPLHLDQGYADDAVRGLLEVLRAGRTAMLGGADPLAAGRTVQDPRLLVPGV